MVLGKAEDISSHMGISSSIALLEDVTPFWVTTLTSWILLLKSFVPVKQKNSNMMVILFDKSSSTSVNHMSLQSTHLSNQQLWSKLCLSILE